MEPEELAESVAITLGFSLPYLLGEKPSDEAVKALGDVGWQEAKMVWDRVLCHSEAHPALLEASRGVASTPGPETMAVLRQRLEEAFHSSQMLAGEIRDLTRDGSHASLFGMPSASLPGAASPKANLLSTQPTYIVLLLLTAGVLWMMGNAGASQANSSLGVFSILLAIFAAKGSFLAYYARKFGLKKPLIIGLAALAPGGYLIAGLSLLAYRPPHLTPAVLAGEAVPQYGELQSWSRWFMLIALLPLALFIGLTLVNIDYYLYFFENIQGILLFAATLLAYGLAVAALWVAFWKRKAYTSPRLALASGISGLCLTFVIWSVLLGPAAAKVVTLLSR